MPESTATRIHRDDPRLLALAVAKEAREMVQGRLDALLTESTAYTVEGRFYPDHDRATLAFVRAEKSCLNSLERIGREIARLENALLGLPGVAPAVPLGATFTARTMAAIELLPLLAPGRVEAA